MTDCHRPAGIRRTMGRIGSLPSAKPVSRLPVIDDTLQDNVGVVRAHKAYVVEPPVSDRSRSSSSSSPQSSQHTSPWSDSPRIVAPKSSIENYEDGLIFSISDKAVAGMQQGGVVAEESKEIVGPRSPGRVLDGIKNAEGAGISQEAACAAESMRKSIAETIAHQRSAAGLSALALSRSPAHQSPREDVSGAGSPRISREGPASATTRRDSSAGSLLMSFFSLASSTEKSERAPADSE